MSDEKFAHLHNHSYFSLLDGLSSIKDMVGCAASLGYKSMALTDHGTCAGLYQFQKQCKESGIKPILGMEAYICDDHSIKDKTVKSYHLILLAKNKIGYKNLIYLSSFGYLNGFYYRPRIDFNVLEKHKEGLIVSSACVGGEIPYLFLNGNEEKAIEVAKKYKDTFASDYYLEIMVHKYFNDKLQEKKEKDVAYFLYNLGKKLGIKVICTQDSHYTRKEDWEAHDVLLSIQTLDNIKNPNRLTFDSDDFYIKPYEQMAETYKKIPEVLLNTVEISDKIESNIISPSTDLLPNFKVPEGFNEETDYLKSLVKNGMKEKGLINNKIYRERIRYEMSVIIGCNYTKYFLILWDIINFARNSGIRVGAGRGSAVSSLCLYVLGITKLDPIKYDLIFERFLNPERISPPDVDIDFDYYRRDEVYNYIINKYGADYCCQIGTYNKFKARAVIRSSSKALDLGNDWEEYLNKKEKNPNEKADITKRSLDIADRISKQIPFKANMTLKLALKTSVEFRESMRKYPKLLACAQHIEGTLSSAGVHPAGILLCKDPVIDRVPLRSSNGVICSQYDGPEVEKLGLLKFDLLALKTLTVIDKTVKMIKERHENYNPLVDNIDELPPDDPRVFGMLNGRNDSRKNTLGVFQFEANGIAQLLANIHVDRFEDMIVANALYRPGPLQGGVHDMYCNFKHGRSKIEYLHPKMGDVLKNTYGIMCFDGDQTVYADNGVFPIKNIKNQNIYFYNKKMGKKQPIKNGSFVSGKDKIYEYLLSNGFSIKCTQNHRFRLLDGSFVDIDHIYKKSIPLPYICNDSIIPVSVDEKEKQKYYLLGFMIGDGALANSTPRICCGKHKEKAIYIKKICKNVYPSSNPRIFWSCRSWYVDIRFKSNKNKFGPNKKNIVSEWLKSIGLNVIGNFKRLPLHIVSKNRNLALPLLAGYLDSDGCLSSDIAFTSGNENLLQDVSYLLWRMGYYFYKSCHSIHVSDSDKLYKELVPYLLKVKNNKKLSCGNRLKLSSEIVSKFIRKDIGSMSEREYCRRKHLNRSSIRKILREKLKYCHYSTVKSIANKFDNTICLFVVNKKFLGRKTTYDISMPSSTGNNFVVAPGIIAHNCYQEDIMKISRVLAGFTGGQADTLRKVVGKKEPELIKKEKLDELFINGCIKNGISEEIAKKIFEQICYFAGYGFNRSHSAAYAYIAYQTAWLKTYYPIEFMCNLLTSEINNNDKNEKLDMYISASKSMDLIIMPENINKSGKEFKIEKGYHSSLKEIIDVIRKPLTSLKGVGSKAVDSIVKNQPYKNIDDFVRKIDARIVNIRVFSTLVESGCMDEAWGQPRQLLMKEYAEAKKAIDKENKANKKREKTNKSFGDANLWEDSSLKVKV